MSEKVRPLFYMAHPVSEHYTSGARGPQYFMDNVRNAERWLGWLIQNDRTRVYIAPWISEVRLAATRKITITYDDALHDDVTIVAKCDGIILTGGRTTIGMRKELDMAMSQGKTVIDLSMFRRPWLPSSDIGKAVAQLLVGGVQYNVN